MNSSRPYLSTRNLAVGYVKRKLEDRLFNNLNLSLSSGEMVCFMGPNGAGKSSLLRTLAGLQKPLSGEVKLQGSPPGSWAKEIAVVLTDRVNALNLTVEEIITFGRYPYLGWNVSLTDDDRRIVKASVDQIRLQPLLNRKIYELSDGQLQMVMIARALAQDTPVVLLDEPTAHLDLNNRVEIMNLLRQLSRSTEKAILIATHELDLALQTADRIWLTGKDKNILTGLPEDLVLNGSFDAIFEFKGFDLKSGKVRHYAFRQQKVRLLGEGAAYLWTRNALERNGFEITPDAPEVSITLVQDSTQLKWIVKTLNSESEADSIEELIKSL